VVSSNEQHSEARVANGITNQLTGVNAINEMFFGSYADRFLHPVTALVSITRLLDEELIGVT
jgi:hypothetical protein